VIRRPPLTRSRVGDASAHWAALTAARRRVWAARTAAEQADAAAALTSRISAGLPYPWEVSDEVAERHEPEWAPDTLKITAPHLYDSLWAVQLWCAVLEWSHEQRRGIDSWRDEEE
jgi:hypothetical protein